ncbi:MAG: nucleotide exchange factor GrpE [Simkaniaceae bacterium]|nr:nucleotide exchange factor GrpE [Simkaniaceae bacterium]
MEEDPHENSEENPDIEELNQETQIDETEVLKQQVKEEQEKYLRTLADMENSRKRMQKEKHDSTRFAVENVIGEFLSPLDNFENALSFVHQASEETQTWAKGFEMILTQFKDILSAHKIIPFTSEGMIFDPHLHEVLELEETDKHEDGMILQEFVKGYKCGDRILRPARVKVAKAPKQEDSENNLDEENNQGENTI